MLLRHLRAPENLPNSASISLLPVLSGLHHALNQRHSIAPSGRASTEVGVTFHVMRLRRPMLSYVEYSRRPRYIMGISSARMAIAGYLPATAMQVNASRTMRERIE